MPSFNKAQRAVVLTRHLHGERADAALRELAQLYPRAVFHHDAASTGLTVLYPQGVTLPKAIEFHANYLIEVRPDSIRVIKDREGIVEGPGSTQRVWEHFQRCTGLEPDGILGPATRAKMREITVLPNKLAVPELRPRSAWERLLEDD